jgi:hypothetical protein
MKKCILTCFAVSILLACSALAVHAAGPATESTTPASAEAPKVPFATPLKWKCSDVLLKPVPDDRHPSMSVKDPTVVFFGDKWHIYATTALRGSWSMQYFNFADWSEAPDAKPYYIDNNPNLGGYHCAPHIFYFTPHKKWYLIFQSQHPQYTTADDLSKPETWPAPQNFFPSKPRSLRGQWIDYHMIADDTHVYLFFTGDDGLFHRSRTTIEEFPKGMSDPEVAIRDSRNNLFEGSITYKIKGTDTYLTLIEALSPTRYYRAWVSNDLNGEWTPLPGADSFQTPWAGINNVTFEEGVEPWTREISHGEMIRDGYDEKMILDPNSLQLLFQGMSPSGGGRGGYNSLPYRLGLLTAVTEDAAEDAEPEEEAAGDSPASE